MILRPKISNRIVAESAEAVVASGQRSTSGARGWQAVVSPAGSTTLWRPRGRIASGDGSRRSGAVEGMARGSVAR